MPSKVTIVVSRIHWRCVSCKLENSHMVSIDQHLKTSHGNLLSLPPAISSCPSECDEGGVCEEEHDSLCQFSRKYSSGESLNALAEDIKSGPFESVAWEKRVCENKTENSSSNRGTDHVSSKYEIDCATVELSWLGQAPHKKIKFVQAAERPQQAKPGQRQKCISDAENLTGKKTRNKRQHQKQCGRPTSSKKFKENLSKCSDGQSKGDSSAEKDKSSSTVAVERQEGDVMKLPAEIANIDSEENTEKQHFTRMEGSRALKSKNKSFRFRLESDRKVLGEALKKPATGGKPVKRTMDIPEKEKNRLKMFYVGVQAKTHTDVTRAVPTAVTVEKSLSLNSICHRDHFGSHLTAVEVSNEQVAQENKEELLTSWTSQSLPLTYVSKKSWSGNNENMTGPPVTMKPLNTGEQRTDPPVTSCENLDKRLAANKHRLNVSDGNLAEDNLLEKSEILVDRFEMDIVNRTGTQIKLTQTHNTSSEILDTDQQSSFLLHDAGVGVHVSEMHPDILQSVNNAGPSNNKHVTPDSDSIHENILPQQLRNNERDLGTCEMTNPTQLLQTLEDSELQLDASENRVPNYSQADNRYNQKAVIKIMQNEPMEGFNHFTIPDSDEWVKNNTKFSFAKTKLAVSHKEPSKIHTCTLCEAKFSEASLLSDHLSKKSSHTASQCEICKKSFHSIYDLNLHVFGQHEKRSKPFCFECGEQFHSMEIFEKHLHQHVCIKDLRLIDMEYHSCKICKCDLSCSYDTLRKHYHNKHKVTVCLECFVRSNLVLMSDPTAVKIHKEIHENFCKICIQDFPSAESLKLHYLSHTDCQHKEDGRGKLCEKCNHWCPNKALAVLHQREHRLQVMRNWRIEKWGLGIACLYCDKVLRNKRNLQRHVTQLHSSSRSYKFHCEFCGKGVDSKNNLKDHIAFHHLNIKRYICDFCHEGFACGPTLRRHTLKEHAKDKQYACEVCGEKFCDKFGLTRHMYGHTGSARLMCDQCGKGFHFSSEFKKHLSVHAEKREFVCHGCGQGYKRKEHLKRHVQKCTKTGY